MGRFPLISSELNICSSLPLPGKALGIQAGQRRGKSNYLVLEQPKCCQNSPQCHKLEMPGVCRGSGLPWLSDKSSNFILMRPWGAKGADLPLNKCGQEQNKAVSPKLLAPNLGGALLLWPGNVPASAQISFHSWVLSHFEPSVPPTDLEMLCPYLPLVQPGAEEPQRAQEGPCVPFPNSQSSEGFVVLFQTLRELRRVFVLLFQTLRDLRGVFCIPFPNPQKSQV